MTEQSMFAVRVEAIATPDGETFGVVGWDKRGNLSAVTMAPELAHDLIVQLLRCAYEAGGTTEPPKPDENGNLFAIPCRQIHPFGSLEDDAGLFLGFGRAAVPLSFPSQGLRQIGTRLLQMADLQDRIARPGPMQ